MRLSEDHTPGASVSLRDLARPDVPGERKRIEAEGAAGEPGELLFEEIQIGKDVIKEKSLIIIM